MQSNTERGGFARFLRSFYVKICSKSRIETALQGMKSQLITLAQMEKPSLRIREGDGAAARLATVARRVILHDAAFYGGTGGKFSSFCKHRI
jgi:hypothetical protein